MEGLERKSTKSLVSMTLILNVTVVHSNVCLVCLSPLAFGSDLDEGMDPGFFFSLSPFKALSDRVTEELPVNTTN